MRLYTRADFVCSCDDANDEHREWCEGEDHAEVANEKLDKYLGRIRFTANDFGELTAISTLDAARIANEKVIGSR